MSDDSGIQDENIRTESENPDKKPMMVQFITPLEDRAIIGIEGSDARKFLQNLITKDMDNVTAENSVYAALLTPQGKFLYDFFVCQFGEDTQRFLLDCQREEVPEIIAKLNEYKLRSNVDIVDMSTAYGVAAIYGEGVLQNIDPEGKAGATKEISGGFFLIDPRSASLYVRAICDIDVIPDAFIESGMILSPREEYDYLRIWIGAPDPVRDLKKNSSFPLDYNFDEIEAIDFNKGCYVGQEVTTRSHRLGTKKKRLFPVFLEGDLPEDGADIMSGKKRIGKFSSGTDKIGLAILNIEDVEYAEASKTPIMCGGTRLRVDNGTTTMMDFAEMQAELEENE